MVIEVETGKSDIQNNIEKIKKYPFDQVILVATNPTAVGKCQRAVEKAADPKKYPVESKRSHPGYGSQHGKNCKI